MYNIYSLYYTAKINIINIKIDSINQLKLALILFYRSTNNLVQLFS